MKFIVFVGLLSLVLAVNMAEAFECTDSAREAFIAARDDCFSELAAQLSLGTMKEKVAAMIKCTADKLKDNSEFDEIRATCNSDDEEEKLDCFAKEFKKACPDLLP